MLGRIAARSIKSRRLPVNRVSSPTVVRYYSKSKAPSHLHHHKLPSPDSFNRPSESARQKSAASPGLAGVVGTSEQKASASESSDGSGSADFSRRQDEFQTAAQPTQDTSAPVNPQQPFEPDSSPDYSKYQDEFQTPPTDQNITPQNTSPSAIDPAETRLREEAAEQAPPIPLHDLTKGIPSTLDEELRNASEKAGMLELNTTESSAGRGGAGGRGRPLPASAYLTSGDRRRERLLNYMFGGMFALLLTSPVFLGRNWENEEEEKAHPEAPNGWGIQLFYNRFKARLGSTMDYYNEPTFPKLLPDPDPAWERSYTLVLSMQDMLLHENWTREAGWRVAKRPGVDYFVRYLSQYYELVLFTSVPSMIAEPRWKSLDPFRIIMWPLFREATRYKSGKYIKDLSYLNRPLSKTLLLDTDPAHASLQPENALILPKWTGDPNDKTLVSLIPFLEYLATLQVADVRTVLASFTAEQKADGVLLAAEFHRRQQLARQKFDAALKKERGKNSSGGSFLSNALGLKPSQAGPGGGMILLNPVTGEPEQTFGEGLEQGKHLQDQIRERGIRGYEMIEREIRENGEKWLKEMKEEEEKAQKEMMQQMKQGANGWFRWPFGGEGGEGKVEGAK